MVPVTYAPEAERDLEAITAFIAKDNPKAAEQFGFRLIERTELLGDSFLRSLCLPPSPSYGATGSASAKRLD